MFLYNTYLVLNAVIIAICYGLTNYGLVISILGEKPSRKSGVIFCIIFYIINMGLSGLLAHIGGESLKGYVMLIWNLGVGSISAIILVFLLIKIYKTRVMLTVSAVMICEFIIMTIASLLQEYLYYDYLEEVQQVKLIIYIFKANTLPNILTLILTMLLVWVLRRFKLSQYFAALFAQRVRAYITVGVSFLLMNSYAIIRFLFGGEIDLEIIIFFTVLIISALFGLLLMAMYATSQEKVKAQADIIVMQQQHLDMLEELRQEMRSFRHDFTNLISGASEQAGAGDLAGVQEFMRSTGGYFDKRLGDEICQLESIANIKIPSLRSLFITKVAIIKQKEINFHLEVFADITENSMRTEDILRCIGILLDNAIEGAERASEKLINMVLLQEQQELYVAVSNTYAEKPDLARIQKGGYSTKGENRGTGIQSIKKILSNYPQCTSRMAIRDNLFRHELWIGM